MSQNQITEHASYLLDKVKLDRYEAALKSVIKPGDVVLDLGAGTGILGLLAARAGAGHVYSVDSGSIIATTEAIAQASGLADRMTFIRGSSTRLQLPHPVDVVVCDQIGGMAYDAGVLDYFADVRTRLLRPNGRLVPGSFQLLAAPVESSDWDEKVGVWRSGPAGFDMSPMFDLAINTEFRVDIPAEAFLGPALPWSGPIAADHAEPITGEAELVVERAGTVNAIAGLFRATLAPGIELTNYPLSTDRFNRWQNLYPLPTPVPVAPGDQVRVRFEVRPRTYLATWSVEVQTSGGDPVRSRGSTILGTFLTQTDIAVAGGHAVAQVSPALAADQFILAMVDGERTAAEIVDATWASHGPAFTSRNDLKHRVESLLWRHTQPAQEWFTSSTA